MQIKMTFTSHNQIAMQFNYLKKKACDLVFSINFEIPWQKIHVGQRRPPLNVIQAEPLSILLYFGWTLPKIS